jgi:hypothetical protein
MTLSFGEIESLSLKASRGAGFAWGLAEETGKAVRLLTERGLAGPETLAVHLPKIAGKDYATLRPRLGSHRWRPQGEALCPLITGVALSDHAGILSDMLTLGPIWNPLLLVPFADRVATRLGQPLALDWPETQIVCGRTGIDANGDLAADLVPVVTITRAGHWPKVVSAKRRDIDPAVIDVLKAYAHRTYVPATEASRLSGAGAGTRDND